MLDRGLESEKNACLNDITAVWGQFVAQSSPYRLVLCTCPDPASADTLARRLVDAALAACVNIVPSLKSVYSWQGQLESATEHLLIIKTRKETYPELEALICANHPYEVPEVISIPIDAGLPAYLAWMDSTLSNR